jgi:hypothetical protein
LLERIVIVFVIVIVAADFDPSVLGGVPLPQLGDLGKLPCWSQRQQSGTQSAVFLVYGAMLFAFDA